MPGEGELYQLSTHAIYLIFYYQVAKNVIQGMKRDPDLKDSRFLCICVPAYNESKDDLLKTIDSIMKNIDFMKHKTR